MEFIIVTGVSGSGKSVAVNALEDIGFFCIDNMPPQLIPPFAELSKNNSEISKVAIVADIRGGSMFLDLPQNIDDLKRKGFDVRVLFIDADNEIIKKRYKETRRKHPLFDVAEGDLDKAIEAERQILSPIKETANYIVNTSQIGTSQLKENIINYFLENVGDSMVISCLSFGFKYGIPHEADLVFDVRCLPNPFYLSELKNLTGTDEKVKNFVMKSSKAKELERKLFDLIDFLIPQYISEGKSQLVIAFGCTGGKHRSITFAENMHSHLNDKNFKVRILHRDIEK